MKRIFFDDEFEDKADPKLKELANYIKREEDVLIFPTVSTTRKNIYRGSRFVGYLKGSDGSYVLKIIDPEDPLTRGNTIEKVVQYSKKRDMRIDVEIPLFNLTYIC